MRKSFRIAGVDETFTSEQFDREWEKSSAKQGDKYQVMEKLVKLPGLRSFDRNFDRLPESLRWIVEKVVHDPEKPPAPKPKLPDDLFETIRGRFGADVAALQEFSGREFQGWHDYSCPATSWPRSSPVALCATNDDRTRLRAVQRLLPDPGPTTVEEELDTYRPWERPHDDRPNVAMNFAATVDGRAAIAGVSGPIGSASDTAMLAGLRTRFGAGVIAARPMRAERHRE